MPQLRTLGRTESFISSVKNMITYSTILAYGKTRHNYGVFGQITVITYIAPMTFELPPVQIWERSLIFLVMTRLIHPCPNPLYRTIMPWMQLAIRLRILFAYMRALRVALDYTIISWSCPRQSRGFDGWKIERMAYLTVSQCLFLTERTYTGPCQVLFMMWRNVWQLFCC